MQREYVDVERKVSILSFKPRLWLVSKGASLVSRPICAGRCPAHAPRVRAVTAIDVILAVVMVKCNENTKPVGVVMRVDPFVHDQS
jgi:hypothetical protein